MFACLLSGCIIPDYDIDVTGAFKNRRPVRIVERTEVPEELNAECFDESGTKRLTECPQPPDVGPPHFMSDTEFRFCRCDPEKGEWDDGALPHFQVYVEDADLTEDDEPKDQILGAFFLDAEPTAKGFLREEPDYTSVLSPSEAARPTSTQLEPIGRPPVKLRFFELEDRQNDGHFDLCNADVVTPGWHSLTLMVTDAPWYSPDDDSTKGAGDRSSRPPFVGVPDLARGATFDTTTYTFHCYARDEDDCATRCRSEDEKDR